MDSCSLSSSTSDLGKLFIGGISWDTDEDRLREYFQNYGEVVEAVIMKDRTTGRARGFGFVVFSDPAVAERVVMDKHVIDGRTVEAKKSVPREDYQHILCRSNSSSSTPHASPGTSPARTKKIFVGGLASTVTEADFKNYFHQFGNITDVVVMYDHNTQRPRGFGFITYDSEDAVDKVLLKTFHELNGKMVEVKRAVPKELSPGPTIRSPLGIGVGGGGYNSYTLNRVNSYLVGNGGYVQGYNPSSIGGFGMRADGRSFGSFAVGRNALPSFGSPPYGMGVNFEPGLNPTYRGNTNFTNNVGYGRESNTPYYTASSTRFSPTIGGYAGSNGGNSSAISSIARNVWGNGSFDYLGGSANSSASGSLGGFGNSGLNWEGSSPPISSQRIGAGSGYGGGNLGFAGGENSFQGGVSFGRTTATAAATSSFTSSSGGFDGNYADTYGGSSVYGDPTWRTASFEIDRSGPFGYGLGNVSSDVSAKDSSGYMGGYNVTGRQSNRDVVTFENKLF